MKIKINLSPMFRDPMLRAAFQRAERDTGPEPVVVCPPKAPVLTDGAAAKIEEVA